MRTTLDLDDALLRAAKERAAREGTSLTRLLEEALRIHLGDREKSKKKAFRLKLLTKKGRLVPGVDLSDRDSVYERMEGRA